VKLKKTYIVTVSTFESIFEDKSINRAPQQVLYCHSFMKYLTANFKTISVVNLQQVTDDEKHTACICSKLNRNWQWKAW